MKISHYLLLFIALCVFVFSPQLKAHKYASHALDARISGNKITVDFQLDTISTLELISENHNTKLSMDRESAIEFRQEVYDYLNERFTFTVGNKKCTPSKLFNFIYINKIDRYTLKYFVNCSQQIDEVVIDFSLFLEQDGLNTTIATILAKKGGERYIFTNRSSATINVNELTSGPRKTMDLMRNYEPGKGFRSEKDRLWALGIRKKVEDNPKVDINNDKTKPETPASSWLIIISGFWAFLSSAYHCLLLFGILAAPHKRTDHLLTKPLTAIVMFLGIFVGINSAAFNLLELTPLLTWCLISLSIIFVSLANLWERLAMQKNIVIGFFAITHGVALYFINQFSMNDSFTNILLFCLGLLIAVALVYTFYKILLLIPGIKTKQNSNKFQWIFSATTSLLALTLLTLQLL